MRKVDRCLLVVFLICALLLIGQSVSIHQANSKLEKKVFEVKRKISRVHQFQTQKKRSISFLERSISHAEKWVKETQTLLRSGFFFNQELRLAMKGHHDHQKNVSRVVECAILVPFRESFEHKLLFEMYMSQFLLEQGINATIVFIAQMDYEPFNRGALLNIGFVLATEMFPNISYVILHDIDQLPIGKVNYGYEELKGMNQGSYTDYEGGVFKLDAGMFRRINGFPNCFWGWTGPDENFYLRLKTHPTTKAFIHKGDYLPIEPNFYFDVCHVDKEQHPVSTGEKITKFQEFIQENAPMMPKPFYTFDGISTLNYTIQKTLLYPSNIIEVQVKLSGRSLDDCIGMYQSVVPNKSAPVNQLFWRPFKR